MDGMAQTPHDRAVPRDGQPRPATRTRAPRARRPVPITPDMLEGAPDFAPAPRGATRYDGWTPDRQRAFVGALAETGCVTRACAWVGMSNVGAYQLRKSPGAEAFARAWDEALAVGVERLSDIAYERAVYGVAVPVFHQGEQVGERRRFNDRLLMWVMRHADRERFDDAPQGHRVPPHVRKALRAEWEREAEEKAARRREEAGESAMEWLANKLGEMHRRLRAAGDLKHLYPDDVLREDGTWGPADR
jgi:hypothetical protein